MISIVNIGDVTVMFPAAAAIAAWLAANRAWRMAFWWCLLFGSGIALVAVSKIAFLAWGTGIRPIDFKAFSGHAMQTAAVLPVMSYLLFQPYPPLRRTAAALGILTSAIVGICLVVYGFHSVPETICGFSVGMTVSLGFLSKASGLNTFHKHHRVLPCSVLAFAMVWCAQPGTLERSMTLLALRLSGHASPYSYITWEQEN